MTPELTPYEHVVKDYILGPWVFVPVAVSVIAALWTWRTARGLERLKGELQRDLVVHTSVLKVAADIESRIHENDIVALRECQKGVAQLLVQCEETLWQIAHQGDLNIAKIQGLWDETVKTYLWLRPWLSVALEPYRKTLEEKVRSVYTTTEIHYDRWDMNRRAGLPPDGLDEGKALEIVDPVRVKATESLDGWAKSLREYRVKLISEVAAELTTQSTSVLSAKKKWWHCS